MKITLSLAPTLAHTARARTKDEAQQACERERRKKERKRKKNRRHKNLVSHCHRCRCSVCVCVDIFIGQQNGSVDCFGHRLGIAFEKNVHGAAHSDGLGAGSTRDQRAR